MFSRSIGKLLNALLNPLGLHLARVKPKSESEPESIVSFNSMLARLRDRSIEVNTVVDVGASDGRWSRRIEPVYPNASYLLIEANDVHKPGLESHAASRQSVEFVMAAAADKPGQVYFDDSDPLGGVASHEPDDNAKKSFPCTTIDSEITKRQWAGPYLIKLDTHGFELPILKGAEKVLEETEVLIIEAYNFNLTGDSPQFWELCAHMNQLGFSVIDIFDPMFRPKDNAFWQLDIIFVRSSRAEFLSNTYT